MDESWAIGMGGGRAAEAHVRVETVEGMSPLIDRIAGPGDAAFLRCAWFDAAEPRDGRTILARRARDGAPLLAIPLGRGAAGFASVPGSYWPFRSVVIARSANVDDVAAALSHPHARRALGPAWRLGPVYEDSFAYRRLSEGARAAGWRRVGRPVGASFIIDVAALRASGPWPRPSTAKTVRRLTRRLEDQGRIGWQEVRGADWTAAVIDDLAAIERESWIGGTDRSGAKFLNPRNRRIWERAVADPALAKRLSALILRLDDRPIAFSFDLDCEPTQYGIAGSFDRRFAHLRPAKIVTHRQIERSLSRGILWFDWGLGDGGYKQELGARAGPRAIDCLFVRSAVGARLADACWSAGVGLAGATRRLLRSA